MKDHFKERSFALFSKKSSFALESESYMSDNTDSQDEYNFELYSSVSIIVKHYKNYENKRFSGARTFLTKSNSSASKMSNDGNSKKDDGKWFNYGRTGRFAHDCKIKNNIPKDESYEEKYMHLVAFLKRQNLESKVLFSEEEEWVEDEESYDEEIQKDVCLMNTNRKFALMRITIVQVRLKLILLKMLVIQNFRTETPYSSIRLKIL